MLEKIGACYRDSARIALSLPLLFAAPFAFELVQHVIEIGIGMFTSVEAAQAVAGHPARMGFGMAKILLLILLIYWVSRSLASRRDGRPIVGDARSAWLFAPVVLLGMAMATIQHFGGSLVAPIVPDEGSLMAIGFAYFALVTVADIYLIPWKVGSALGNGDLSIPASFRVMKGNFLWSLGFNIAMTLPLMAVHYALNVAAMGRPETLVWLLMAADSVVVGYLALVLATAVFTIATRAAERSGVPLDAPARPGVA